MSSWFLVGFTSRRLRYGQGRNPGRRRSGASSGISTELGSSLRHEWEMEAVNRSRFWNLVFRFNEAPEIPLIGKIIGPTEAVELVERVQDGSNWRSATR